MFIVKQNIVWLYYLICREVEYEIKPNSKCQFVGYYVVILWLGGRISPPCCLACYRLTLSSVCAVYTCITRTTTGWTDTNKYSYFIQWTREGSTGTPHNILSRPAGNFSVFSHYFPIKTYILSTRKENLLQCRMWLKLPTYLVPTYTYIMIK